MRDRFLTIMSILNQCQSIFLLGSSLLFGCGFLLRRGLRFLGSSLLFSYFLVLFFFLLLWINGSEISDSTQSNIIHVNLIQVCFCYIRIFLHSTPDHHVVHTVWTVHSVSMHTNYEPLHGQFVVWQKIQVFLEMVRPNALYLCHEFANSFLKINRCTLFNSGRELFVSFSHSLESSNHSLTYWPLSWSKDFRSLFIVLLIFLLFLAAIE